MKPIGALYVYRLVQLLALEIAAASSTLLPVFSPSYFQSSLRASLMALTPSVSPCRKNRRAAHCEKQRWEPAGAGGWRVAGTHRWQLAEVAVPFRIVEGGEKDRRGFRARVHKDLVGGVAELQGAEVALRENRASGEVALGRVRQMRFVVGVVSHIAECISGQRHTGR